MFSHKNINWLWEDTGSLLKFTIGKEKYEIYGSSILLDERSELIRTTWSETKEVVGLNLMETSKIEDKPEFRIIWAWLNGMINVKTMAEILKKKTRKDIINNLIEFSNWFMIDVKSDFYLTCIDLRNKINLLDDEKAPYPLKDLINLESTVAEKSQNKTYMLVDCKKNVKAIFSNEFLAFRYLLRHNLILDTKLGKTTDYHENSFWDKSNYNIVVVDYLDLKKTIYINRGRGKNLEFIFPGYPILTNDLEKARKYHEELQTGINPETYIFTSIDPSPANLINSDFVGLEEINQFKNLDIQQKIELLKNKNLVYGLAFNGGLMLPNTPGTTDFRGYNSNIDKITIPDKYRLFRLDENQTRVTEFFRELGYDNNTIESIISNILSEMQNFHA